MIFARGNEQVSTYVWAETARVDGSPVKDFYASDNAVAFLIKGTDHPFWLLSMNTHSGPIALGPVQYPGSLSTVMSDLADS